MDMKDKRRWSADKTEEMLHHKIERISRSAEDRCLTADEVHTLKNAWKTMWYIKQFDGEH